MLIFAIAMRTVKQFSGLTWISVPMLHYYDEIELIKPSALTEVDYMLYNHEAIEILQQILFFKNLIWLNKLMSLKVEIGENY
jgi:DNA-binding transcriptional MerR regulator